MAKNKINFITGETYTLAELFSGERRIIIPDLQRDYCWGNNTNKKSSGESGELVSDFVKNLIDQYESRSSEYDTLNLGLLYGYEVPADHIQLCDGQQRLTTLFLMLGVLNKETGLFLNHLISDYELKHDDHEPYLNYAIRESSLYFLSDLVCQYFTEKDRQIEDIKKSEWYFADYDLDPSIQSIISAIGIIEKIFSVKDAEWLSQFGTWVLHHLTFMYFDMENRKNGEETFVIINSTGEPLSIAQNIKPLVINAPKNKNISDVVEKWEKIETWFWRKRDKENNDTADAGLTEFLRWVYMIETFKEAKKAEEASSKRDILQQTLQGKSKEQFPYNRIDFNTIYKYWYAVGWLFTEEKEIEYDSKFLSPSSNKDVNGLNAIGQNDCFTLLPVLMYVESCINIEVCRGVPSFAEIVEDSVKIKAKRIYEFLRNVIRLSNVSKAVNSLVYDALNAVALLDQGEILSLLERKDEISKQLLTDEELWKLELLKQSDDRSSLERLFWKSQGKDLWKGEISPLLELSCDENNIFDCEKFKKYESLIDETLLVGAENHDKVTTLMRRAMIVALPQYRPIQRGAYYSFGWKWEDWHKFFDQGAKCGIKELLDYIQKKVADGTEKALKDYIQEKLTSNNEFAGFAKDDFLISFTNKSYACDMAWGLSDWQICTHGSASYHQLFFSRRNADVLKAFEGDSTNTSENKHEFKNNSGWFVWYESGSYDKNCVVLENEKVSVKMEIRYLSEKNVCEIEMKSSMDDISSLANNMGFVMEKDSTNKPVKKIGIDFDANNIKQYIENEIKKLNEQITS